jgi:Chromosome segregation ATPases
LVEEGRDLIKIFFDKMTSKAYHHFDPNSKYSTKKIMDDLNEHFTPLEKELNELKSALHSLRNHIRKLREELLEMDETREEVIELHQLFDRSEGSLSDILILTESITSNQNKEYVYWYEGNFRTISGATQLILTVNMAPIQPGIELANSIFKSIDFCILTSATLRTKLSFDYFFKSRGFGFC